MTNKEASLVRTKSLLTNQNSLEHLYTLRDFPVFMGCVDIEFDRKDIVADMRWDICKETGIIQLHDPLPLELLYMDQHNDGTGKVWADHYREFSLFISEFKPEHILELGGAHNKIAENFWKHCPNSSWTIVEPNPKYITNPNIKVISDWFDESFSTSEKVDAVIHSHVLEHTYNPVAFIQHIGKFLAEGQMHIFTFPNMLPMLEKNWTNCLNFEHTAFLTEEIVETLLAREGFKIIKKSYFGDPHSIFYATRKTKVKESKEYVNNYLQYKEIFTNYINYHRDLIADLNKKIEEAENNIYIFGAHIFTQYLINFGLRADKIVSILDNSPIKIGKKLYGTDLAVQSPEILRSNPNAKVILKVASYEKEIREQIMSINDQVEFW